MVAEGAERCPACGARVQPRVLDKASGFTWPDLLNYSLVGIVFGLIAIVAPLLILLVCLAIYLLLGSAG
jgi:hypothetical protein